MAILESVTRTIAENLQAWREARGLTQDQVAARMGTKQAQYSKWENAVAIPKPTSLLKLALALEVNVDALLHGLNGEYDRVWGRPAKAPPGPSAARARRAGSR